MATTQQLAATVGASNVTGSVTWVSDDEDVATVSSGGLVTAVGVGSTQVTATYEGMTAHSDISVADSVASVSINQTSVTVGVGATSTATATIHMASGSTRAPSGGEATWSSSAPETFTVGASTGLVTGVAQGTGQLAVSADGHTNSVSVSVTVSAPEPAAKDVRAWAAANNVDAPPRGKLPQDVVDQYKAATKGA